MTAGALFGFHLSPSVLWLALFAVPLGLGAGAVDAGLNNYVALHYEAHHMNWLHSFWGVGATLGPVIMGRMILSSGKWNNGYLVISIIQASLVLILLLSLPLWDKHNRQSKSNKAAAKSAVISQDANNNTPAKAKNGMTLALISFFFYCGVVGQQLSGQYQKYGTSPSSTAGFILLGRHHSRQIYFGIHQLPYDQQAADQTGTTDRLVGYYFAGTTIIDGFYHCQLHAYWIGSGADLSEHAA